MSDKSRLQAGLYMDAKYVQDALDSYRKICIKQGLHGDKHDTCECSDFHSEIAFETLMEFDKQYRHSKADVDIVHGTALVGKLTEIAAILRKAEEALKT